MSYRLKKEDDGLLLKEDGGALLFEFLTAYLVGSLNSYGALQAARKVLKNIAGVLYFQGALTAKIVAFGQAVGGTLNLAGSLVRKTYKSLAGTLGSSGAITRNISLLMTGRIWWITGALHRYNIYKAMSGVITPSGALDLGKWFWRGVGGTLNLSGSLLKEISKMFTGSLTFTGAVKKYTQLIIVGTMNASGKLIKSITKSLQGILSLVGLIIRPGRSLQMFLFSRPYRDMNVDTKPYLNMHVETKEGGEL